MHGYHHNHRYPLAGLLAGSVLDYIVSGNDPFGPAAAANGTAGHDADAGANRTAGDFGGAAGGAAGGGDGASSARDDPAAVTLVSFCLLRGALVLFGMGEGFAMTPVMEDMIHSTSRLAASRQPKTIGQRASPRASPRASREPAGVAGDGGGGDEGSGSEDEGEEDADARAVDPDGESPEMRAIGGIVTSAFALGQIMGPLMGTTLTSRLGFETASTVMACALCLLVPLVGCCAPSKRGGVWW